MRNRETVLTLALALLGLMAILSAIPSFAQNDTTTDMQTNQSMSQTNATSASNSTAEMAGVEGESGQISGCKRCR